MSPILSIVMIACLCMAMNLAESKSLRIPVRSPWADRKAEIQDANECKKTCGREAIDPFNDIQKMELELYTMQTEHIVNKKEYVDNQDNQRDIVTLTSEQQQEILASYGDLFATTEQIESKIKLREEAMASEVADNGETNNQRKKRAATTRVCPAVQVYEALKLALTEYNILVQVIQIPGVDSYQWFLQESCQHDTSQVADAECGETDRLVQALIIDLSSYNIQYEWIKVRSCVAFV